MLSRGIWALFQNILTQNGIKKPIVDPILGGGGAPAVPPSGSATTLN